MSERDLKKLAPAFAVVLGVVLLFGIVFFGGNKDKKAFNQCCNNLKTLKRAVERYKKEKGEYPATLDMIPHAILSNFPKCPAAGHDTYSTSYSVEKDSFQIHCSGHNHAKIKIPPHYPRIDEKGLYLKN